MLWLFIKSHRLLHMCTPCIQDDPKAAEGLALAATALEAANPLIKEAEEAQKAAESARSDFHNISR